MKQIITFLLLIFSITLGVDPQLVEKAIHEALITHFDNYERVEMKIISRPDQENKLEQAKIKVFLPEMPVGIVRVPVVFETENSSIQASYVVRVNVYDEVFTLSQAVKPNQVLSIEDLDKDICDISLLLKRGSQPLNDVHQLAELRVKKRLKKGDILSFNLLEKIPVVLAQKELELKMQLENVFMTCWVIALEEGNIGDEIKVMHPDYKKIVRAKIIDEGSVLLERGVL